MGLCIAVQSEAGEQVDFVADTKNLLDKLLGYPDLAAYPMLASIDRYGDTSFNRMQLERFLAEWDTLWPKAATTEEKELLEAVRRLAQKAQLDVHQYLVFIGD